MMAHSEILIEEIKKYKLENEYFNERKFADVQILHVIFEAMDRIEALNNSSNKKKLIKLINNKRKAKDIGYALIYCIDTNKQVEELADEIVKLFTAEPSQDTSIKEAEKIAKGSTLLATIKSEFPERCVGDLEQDLYRMINQALNINDTNSCNECGKELDSGTVFCSADCRYYYHH